MSRLQQTIDWFEAEVEKVPISLQTNFVDVIREYEALIFDILRTIQPGPWSRGSQDGFEYRLAEIVKCFEFYAAGLFHNARNFVVSGGTFNNIIGVQPSELCHFKSEYQLDVCSPPQHDGGWEGLLYMQSAGVTTSKANTRNGRFIKT
ncbi:hypothetical protein CVT26_006285 [Gymnopilus dilepis]|uniref:Uncharacterized protein n=1 Tax=Gymnopilus dilepis TaxID=231916 RepID=A0A409VYS1_9AGAR|nr:hypothetical protein CVT26_006285 [Gymnopilus dilepis]